MYLCQLRIYILTNSFNLTKERISDRVCNSIRSRTLWAEIPTSGQGCNTSSFSHRAEGGALRYIELAHIWTDTEIAESTQICKGSNWKILIFYLSHASLSTSFKRRIGLKDHFLVKYSMSLFWVFALENHFFTKPNSPNMGLLFLWF